ncbi:uncharacterized protein LOC128335334 [Hemicordylus capensis]|uniref:uncharacterized protein LOC128335334 n=1 Tax=Hemicordylus capensis TaxID=884348 RepID=UPI0023024358|nr:uncharacterized protein LOC128335334 [Hemicordylus capensis]
MGRALGSILIFLLVVGVARSSGGAEGNDLCPGLTDGALAESFQGPGRLNEANAKFCCGTCSAPYWCSSEDARLDQTQCLTAGQLKVTSEIILEQVTTEVPGQAPDLCSDKFPTWVIILIFFLGMFPGVVLPYALRCCYRRFWLDYEDLSQAEQQLPPEEIQPPQTGSVAAHLPSVQDPYYPSASSLLENRSVPGTGSVNPVYQAGGVTNSKPAVSHDATAPSSSSGPILEVENCSSVKASPSPDAEAAHGPEMDPSAQEGLPAPASIDDPPPCNPEGAPGPGILPPALDNPPDGQWSICLVEIPEDEGGTELSLV